MYEGVVNGIDLGMLGYMGHIDVLLTFCPRPTKGLGSDPKKGKLVIKVLVYNGFWNVVVTAPNPGCVWACVAIGGTKPGGKSYMDIVLMAIVVILLGAWVVVVRQVVATGAKTGSNGWVVIGQCCSLSSSYWSQDWF